MRLGGVILALMLPFLTGCKILPPILNAPTPASADLYSTSDVGPSGAAQDPGNSVRPKPRPAALSAGGTPPVAVPADPPAAAELAPAASVPQKSKDQITCEKRGGNWAKAGKSNLNSCIQRTRDAGKQCRKQTDCTSVCLARSGTCAPLKPLFGCNEILQNDGSRVTLCID